MPFLVQGCLDDHTLAVTAATAKEAFAKAVEWQETGRFAYVSISDSTKAYSIDAFASVMALLEIANTVKADAALGRKASSADCSPRETSAVSSEADKTAIEVLMMVSRGGPPMLARIGV